MADTTALTWDGHMITFAPTLGTIFTPKRESNHLPRNLALGGLAATSIVAGGVIGQIRGNPLLGLGIGAAIAAVGVGAALLGNASESYGDYDYPSGGTGRSYPSGGSGGRTSPGDDGGSSRPPSGGSGNSGNSTSNGNPSESDF